jgi:methionyl-tRNA formyltransferase
LISCSQIITADDRKQYKKSLVLHASDLPLGRGWSPHIWEIIKGAEQITLTLLEAEDQVDSGDIWKKIKSPIPKHYLYDEINNALFTAELELIDFVVSNFHKIEPKPQGSEIEPTYYPKRCPQDSEIDPHSSLATQFDQLRICDPERFPAFFTLHGKKYKISLEKLNE